MLNGSEKKNKCISGVSARLKACCGRFLSACRGLGALIPGALGMLVAAAVLVSSSTAFYVTNRDTGGLNSTVGSDSVDPSIMPYALFVKTLTDAENQTYTVNVYNNSEQAALNSYDAIFNRNEFSSAYIRMPVYGVQSGDTLTFTVTANGPLSEDGTATDSSGHNQLMSQYISNIISISCANIPSTTLSPSADRDTVYAGAKSYFDSATAEEKTFVTYDPAPSARQSVGLTGKSAQISFVLDSSDYVIENGMVYVYFKIDYKYELVDAYLTALRLQLGGFKIGQAGHTEFSGILDQTFDLERIEMTVV